MFSKSCRPFDETTLAREPLLASEEFCSGNYSSALERSERFVSMAPNESWPWRFRGECLFSLQQWAEASECFDRAISLGGSGTRDTQLWKAMALERTGDLGGARNTLEELLEESVDAPADVRDKAREHLRSLAPAVAV